tara:strand:- start:719 stop:889 length:171 start_codon:yes stop_codon:yes gene_type:complete
MKKTITIKLTRNQAIQLSTLIDTSISTPADEMSMYYSDKKRYNTMRKIVDKIYNKL